MTTHQETSLGYPIKATEDLSGAKNKFVTFAGTIAQAASGRAVAGLNVSNVGSGYNHQVIFSGINRAYVGAAVTSVGWPAAVANSGWLTNATSGAVVVGRFLATASSGDLVEVGIETLGAGIVLA